MPKSPLNGRSKALIFLVLATACHLLTDSFSSCLAPLWPSIREKFGLSIGQTSFMITCFLFSASLLQPVYGIVADKILWRGAMIIGPLVAAVFIGAVGLYTSPLMVVTGIMIGGAGVAFFHPTSTSLVGSLPLQRKGVLMSVFIAGGTMGFALGPWVISRIVHSYGLAATWYVTLPAVAVVLAAAVGLWRLPKDVHPHHGKAGEAGSLRMLVRGPVIILLAVVVCRSLAAATVQNFLPMWLSTRGWDVLAYGKVVTLFLLFGSIGSFIGGYVSDRVGRKPVIIAATAAAFPCYLGLVFTEGTAFTACVIMAGFFTLSFTSVSVVYAQELAPKNRGTASAMMTGMSWGLAGLVMTPVGYFADRFGFPTAILAVSCALIPATLAACFLPETLKVPPGGAVEKILVTETHAA